MIDLVNRINGYIRHSSRLVQLNRVCTVLGVELLSPDLLHLKHGWFAGFFDAKGKLDQISPAVNVVPHLYIEVASRNLTDLAEFKKFFGGNIYFDKGHNGYYKWYLDYKDSFTAFLDYVKLYPIRSTKRNRLFLIKEFNRVVNY